MISPTRIPCIYHSIEKGFRLITMHLWMQVSAVTSASGTANISIRSRKGFSVHVNVVLNNSRTLAYRRDCAVHMLRSVIRPLWSRLVWASLAGCLGLLVWGFRIKDLQVGSRSRRCTSLNISDSNIGHGIPPVPRVC